MPRCLLVSNRLPLSFNSKQSTFVPSSGGLASAIKGLDPSKVGFDFEWMGILTDEISSEQLEKLKSISSDNLPYHPIIVPVLKYDQYYNLYCNNVLWPLFHYERNVVRHSQEGWEAYCEINKLVAQAVINEATDKDIVWVHDFQLMLVPGYVKEKRPNMKIGFFLHIPFPSSEIFRELPQRNEILHSLLQCDQIGFHDLSYLNHFRSSIQRILGELPTTEKTWGVYPISIDAEHFQKLAQKKETQDYFKIYHDNKRDMKWILGVDRLDYIKGLLLKLSAFKSFLKRYPEERGKVQLVQIVIPSRTDVPEYKLLKNKIEQMASSINGEFGSPTWMPVQYIYHSISENELSALYQISEVLFISSRRDGMNLVSLEYVISQQKDNPGLILLSEFAGAHSTLSYAMSINPWNIKETANKIKDSLHHSIVKRRSEMEAMKNFLENYTSSDWARIILRDLVRTTKELRKSQIPDEGIFNWMKDLRGKRVLFFCDLDGTLAPISSHPKNVRLQGETIQLLREIGKNSNCEFVVISGRDKEFLEEQFIDNDFDFALAACHGAYVFSPDDHRWHNLIPQDSVKWKEKVLEILDLYTVRTPGSFIEDKGHALAWHYRNSPREFAEFLSTKLFFELEEVLANDPVQVNRGKKVIEIKSVHANKGYFVKQWILRSSLRPEVVVAIGDDTTDEDMFAALEGRTDILPFCIKVGDERSHAKYYIKEQSTVNQFLDNFIASVEIQNEELSP